ncbi:hypothetical protein [Anaplasma phagocytophilum]|nr:hypothetical protein [Anaplasma phagocytophilum]
MQQKHTIESCGSWMRYVTQARVVNPSSSKKSYGFCNASERDYVVILEDLRKAFKKYICGELERGLYCTSFLKVSCLMYRFSTLSSIVTADHGLLLDKFGICVLVI